MSKRTVLVRDNQAGVYVGTLVIRGRKTQTTLLNARQIYSWKGRLNVDDIASRGVGEGSEVTGPVARVTMFDVVAIVDVSDEAAAQIAAHPAWHQ